MARVLYVIEGMNPQTMQWEPVKGPGWRQSNGLPTQPPVQSLAVFVFRDQADAAMHVLKSVRPELAPIPMRVSAFEQAVELPNGGNTNLGAFGST